MTDKEVIKALECCGNVITSSCKECSYHITYNANCVRELMRNTLDLINRQQAEIERLQSTHPTYNFEAYQEVFNKAKAGAIKEFAERLKAKCDYYNDYYSLDYGWMIDKIADDIDNLVKEMVGE